MNPIRECKQDRSNLKEFDQRLVRLIKDIAEEAGDLRSRNLQRDDEDLGVAYDHYRALLEQLKDARTHTSKTGRLVHHFKARLVTLKAQRPKLFDRVFRRRRLKEAQA